MDRNKEVRKEKKKYKEMERKKLKKNILNAC
jgi:hypothetical protein